MLSSSSRIIQSAVGKAVVANRSARPILQHLPSIRCQSTAAAPKVVHPTSRYAVVDHSAAYEDAIVGPHGRQLALAQLEGVGKDDPPYDPFIEEEMEEDRQRRLAEGEEDDEEDDEDYDEEDDDSVSPYHNDGSLRWKKSQLSAFRAGAAAGGRFAVVELGGTQHKVTHDDLIVSNLLKPTSTYKIGSTHTLTDVLLVGSSHQTLVGLPYVTGAEVDVMVEEITRDEKVVVFKKRRRKNSRRKNGFRRDVTLLRVLDVRPPAAHANDNHVPRPVPDLD